MNKLASSHQLPEGSGLDTSRLLSFSDGVIAVIITILVLEFKVPSGYELHDLQPLLPAVLVYLLSFRQIATYWANHHHLLRLAHHASNRLIWANLNLLFTISLVPFATAWLGEHYNRPWPVALYGFIALAVAVAYNILQRTVLAEYPSTLVEHTRFRRDIKGKLSLLAYVAGVGLAFVNVWISIGLYVAVAIAWLVPERRVEDIATD
ncbi:MAG TPA: TMEM175 family protein [Candidatus Saccharimonadales bacterium]|nr:TMEM175 family protein [Candidatus Saccharimonadales bacterium]